MKCFKAVVVLLAFLFFLKSNAQNLEYGKVSKEELQEKVHPLDSTAAAAIIFKKAKSYFVYETGKGFYVYHDYELRIKVYKKEGMKWGDLKVSYYGEDDNPDSEKVNFFNCTTYNLEKGVVTKTMLSEEGKLKTKINKYWNEILINMPNVKTGSVIEIKYSLKTKNTSEFPVFNFQYKIPTNFVEYFTEIPEKYVYKTILTGYNKINVVDKVLAEKESYSYKFNEYSIEEFKYKQSKYTAENIPALKQDNFIDNIDNYRASIQHELEGFRSRKEEPIENYSITWDGVAAYIFSRDAFGLELNKDNYFGNDLKTLIKDTEDSEIVKVFEFVKEKMQWNNKYSIYADKGVKKAYNEGTGNSAEINFILIAMLKSAGIKTDPVLISTIDHGVPVYPNRTVFNSVIAAVEIEGKQILLDASNKYSSVGILPLEDLNWTGRLITAEGSSQEINLVPDKNSNENVNIVVALDAQGKMVGQARIRKTDYVAQRFRESTALLTNDKYLEKFESDLGGILIDDYKKINDNSDPSSIIESFTFSSDKHCEIIAGKMYLNPLLFFNSTQNPFVMETRQMPVYFGFPKTERFNINLEIPKGYKVTSVPQPLKISMVNAIGSFSMNIVYDNDKIQIVIAKEINLAVVPPDLYDALKDFFQKMIDKQNEKIVLTKI